MQRKWNHVLQNYRAFWLTWLWTSICMYTKHTNSLSGLYWILILLLLGCNPRISCLWLLWIFYLFTSLPPTPPPPPGAPLFPSLLFYVNFLSCFFEQIGPNVSISANVRVGAGVRLIGCIVLDDVEIKVQNWIYKKTTW